jgi:hypothetical protein
MFGSSCIPQRDLDATAQGRGGAAVSTTAGDGSRRSAGATFGGAVSAGGAALVGGTSLGGTGVAGELSLGGTGLVGGASADGDAAGGPDAVTPSIEPLSELPAGLADSPVAGNLSVSVEASWEVNGAPSAALTAGAFAFVIGALAWTDLDLLVHRARAAGSFVRAAAPTAGSAGLRATFAATLTLVHDARAALVGQPVAVGVVARRACVLGLLLHFTGTGGGPDAPAARLRALTAIALAGAAGPGRVVDTGATFVGDAVAGRIVARVAGVIRLRRHSANTRGPRATQAPTGALLAVADGRAAGFLRPFQARATFVGDTVAVGIVPRGTAVGAGGLDAALAGLPNTKRTALSALLAIADRGTARTSRAIHARAAFVHGTVAVRIVQRVARVFDRGRELPLAFSPGRALAFLPAALAIAFVRTAIALVTIRARAPVIHDTIAARVVAGRALVLGERPDCAFTGAPRLLARARANADSTVA